MTNELPWWLSDLAFPTVVALISGVGGTVLWEAVIKPHQDRRRVAEALRVEIQVNGNMIELAQAQRAAMLADESTSPGAREVPISHFSLGTQTFDALASSVAELGQATAYEVVALYHQYGRVNAFADQHQRAFEAYKAAAGDVGPRAAAWNDVASVADVLRVQLDEAVQLSRKVWDLLGKVR
jgi:hypothetical protein